MPSERRRKCVSDFICNKIRNTLGPDTTKAFSVGSSALKTYLPDADLDIAVFIPEVLAISDDTTQGRSDRNPRMWFISLCEALCIEAVASERNKKESFGGKLDTKNDGDRNNLQCVVRNVTFINAEVRIVKCLVDNVAVDITVNQRQSLDALIQFEEADRKFGRKYLFKQSVIAIKAWCLYESSKYAGQSILGAHNNGLSSYALQLMILALFKTYKGVNPLTHPFQLLVLFFACYADFDWPNQTVTVDGPVPNSSLTPTSSPSGSPTNGATKQRKDGIQNSPLIPDSTLHHSTAFPIRSMNVLDPMNANNNAARSVSPQGMDRLQRALQGGRRHLSAIVNTVYRTSSQDAMGKCETAVADMFFAFFSVTHHKYGDYNNGFRPDLLHHPCQHWTPSFSPPSGPCNLETDLNHSRLALREVHELLTLKATESDSSENGTGSNPRNTTVASSASSVHFVVVSVMMVILVLITYQICIRCEVDHEKQVSHMIVDVVDLVTGFSVDERKGRGGGVDFMDDLSAICKTIPTTPSINDNSLLTQWIRLGSAITFSCHASSIAEAKFQWRLNGNPIHGATSSLHTINNVGKMDSGTYTCIAYNSVGQVTQEEATLRISDFPTTNSAISVDSVVIGASYYKEIYGEGLPQPKYQWRKNGVDLPGQVSNNLYFEKTSWDHAGTYTCKVYNVAGTTEWEELTLNIINED